MKKIKVLKAKTISKDGREAYVADVYNKNDYGVHEEIILKAEGDLWLFVKADLKHVLNYRQVTNLMDVVEKYANECFVTGQLSIKK